MKLFLSSVAIPDKVAYANLFDSIEKPRIGIVANAWGVYDSERSKPYIDAIESLFKEMNMFAERIDLLDFAGKKDELDKRLSQFDGIWITGGNSYYLNWCVHQSGFHEIIEKHCKRGLVYGGESAGAILAGPTLNNFQAMDNPADAPEVILDGLNLTNIVVVPHADNKKYVDKLTQIKDALVQDGFETVALNDSEALVFIEGRYYKVG